MLAYFILYPFVYVKACEGKLIRYPFLFNDIFMSLKVHCRNPFLHNLIEFFVISRPVECRRLNGYAIIQQGERRRTLRSVRRSREISFFKLVGFVYHPGRSRGISKSLMIQLSNFISLLFRGFTAHWMSIKNKTRRFVYERSRVLASHLFIKNCNTATKIKGGTYVEKFV